MNNFSHNYFSRIRLPKSKKAGDTRGGKAVRKQTFS